MKLLKWSWLGVFALAFVLIACQKDAVSPSEISAAKGGSGGGGTPPVAFVLNIPSFGTACEGGEYCFDASFTNRGGNPPGGPNNVISVAVLDAMNAEVSATILKTNDLGHSANFCISGLAEGSYSVRVTYSHTPSENSQPTQGTYSFPLTIQSEDNCGSSTCEGTGLLLSRNASTIETDANFNAVNVTVHYTVSNCSDDDYTGLKLQGGLVNKAKHISSGNAGDGTSVAPTVKTTNGNTVLTWTFNLAAGKSHTFSVYYQVAPTACGNPLTGQWSLKKNSTVIGDVSDPGTNGYLARLYWVCP